MYGGSLTSKGGGVLPPTDPRLQDITDEQMDLDILMFLEDHPELKKKAESYTDSEYEQAMQEELGPETPQIEEPNDWIEEPIE